MSSGLRVPKLGLGKKDVPGNQDPSMGKMPEKSGNIRASNPFDFDADGLGSSRDVKVPVIGMFDKVGGGG